jgi:hypothetical protein
MERNTMTTIGELQIGDRFVYLKKLNDVWEVVSKTGNYASVNQFPFPGQKKHTHDVIQNKNIKVRFLRHTIEQQQTIK